MFGKVSTRTLIIIVAALVLLYVLSSKFSMRSQERTFRENVLTLDTAAVASIVLRPRKMQGGEIRLDRKGSEWTVSDSVGGYSADPEVIRTVLGNFLTLRAKRMAGMMDAVRDRHGLNDSLGIPVTFILADGSKHELLLGRSSHGNSGQPLTYVNIPGEEEVYAVEGLLANQLDQAVKGWRTRVIVKGDPISWQRLTFTFPGDSGYTLARSGSQWLVDSLPGDSSKIENFLKSLARSQAHDFADSVDVTPLLSTYKLEIQDRARPTSILVQVFPWQQGYVATSSQNPGNVMRFDALRELPRMFRPRVNWLAPSAPPAPAED